MGKTVGPEGTMRGVLGAIPEGTRVPSDRGNSPPQTLQAGMGEKGGRGSLDPCTAV